MAQWLRVSLPMRGTRVHALVREDPTCRGAAGPVTMAAEPARPEPVLRNGRDHNSERPAYRKKKKKVDRILEGSNDMVRTTKYANSDSRPGRILKA